MDRRRDVARRYRETPLWLELAVALIAGAAVILLMWLSSRRWDPPWLLATAPLFTMVGSRSAAATTTAAGSATDSRQVADEPLGDTCWTTPAPEGAPVTVEIAGPLG